MMDMRNEEKYINAILFLCKRIDGSIIGKKKLYKLLYYIDFDNYEYKESMHPITGEQYIAWKMGPVPSDKGKILNKMVEQGLLREDDVYISDGINNAKRYTSLVEPNMDVFSGDEKFIMERVAKKYGELNGKQLEILTHAEAPYIATEQNEIIDYGLAFYRETVFNDNLVTSR